jgi:PAS domain S-box-containing protein
VERTGTNSIDAGTGSRRPGRGAARRTRTASVAWQLALAQEFGGAYPFEWNAETGEVVIAAAAKARLGLGQDGALTGTTLLARVHAEDRERLAIQAQGALHTRRPFESEARIALTGEEMRWFLLRGRALAGEGPPRLAGVALDISRRKQAESALAEKERLLGLIQENALDGVAILGAERDPDGRVTDFRWRYCNEAAARMLGRPRGAFAGLGLRDDFPAGCDGGLFDLCVRVVETGEPMAQEILHVVAGRQVALRAAVTRAEDGVGVTFADLTERRAAEERVRVAESRWRAILDTMPQMVWSAQPDGSHDFFNARWYEFTGVPRGTTDGASWAEIFHPEDRPLAWERWQHSLATGEPYEVEYRLRHHSGAWRWALGRALPLHAADGTIERWFGTCTDIDDIKRIETLLKASEARLRNALDAAEVVGTWDWDVVGSRIYADPRMARLYGLDPEAAAAGVGLEAFTTPIHPDDRAMVERGITESMEKGTRCVQEYRLLRPDGSIVWVSARGQCDYDGGGRPVRFPGAAIDITERKRIEEARELLARELSHRIKNIFAVVNSLVMLSARDMPDAQPFVDRVRARIGALGLAHDYVRPSPAESHAAAGVRSAKGLFETLVEPYQAAGADRVTLVGDDAEIGVHAATALALVVHELATNAVKYGALSANGGRVEITCATRDGRYEIRWRESGGPEVTGPPSRRGFGTVMSERAAAAQLSAEVRHEWERDGLRVLIAVPMEDLGR